MASVFSHPAVPLALAVSLGPDRVPSPLVEVACVASVLPDIDAIGFLYGVPYGHPFGHRGFTHSFFFAFLLAILCVPFARRLEASPLWTFTIVFVSAASHGFLDAMTTGGLGVAFFSPFSNTRYFLPWRVIVVSPIGISPFVSRWGWEVLKSELVWIWAPCGVVAGALAALRRIL